MSDAVPRASELFGDAGYVRSRTFALLDFQVAIHSDDGELIDLVEELFAETATSGPAHHTLALGAAPVDGRAGCFSSLDGSVIVRTPARGIAFTNLVFEANQQAIERSVDSVRLHASAVSIGGRAVVMPGAMGAGKSTLAASLTQRGGGYITDEVVAFDGSTGFVRGYARPLSLGSPPPSLPLAWEPSGSGRRYLGSSGLVPPAAVGVAVRGATPLGAVVLPRYVPEAGTTVEPLDVAEGLAAVAAHAFHLERPGTLAGLADRLDGIPVFRLTSADLHGAAEAVESIMGAFVA